MALLISMAFMASGNAIAPTNHTEVAIYAEQSPSFTNAPPMAVVAGSKGKTAIDAKSYNLVSRPMLGIRGKDC